MNERTDRVVPQGVLVRVEVRVGNRHRGVGGHGRRLLLLLLLQLLLHHVQLLLHELHGVRVGPRRSLLVHDRLRRRDRVAGRRLLVVGGVAGRRLVRRRLVRRRVLVGGGRLRSGGSGHGDGHVGLVRRAAVHLHAAVAARAVAGEPTGADGRRDVVRIGAADAVGGGERARAALPMVHATFALAVRGKRGLTLGGVVELGADAGLGALDLRLARRALVRLAAGGGGERMRQRRGRRRGEGVRVAAEPPLLLAATNVDGAVEGVRHADELEDRGVVLGPGVEHQLEEKPVLLLGGGDHAGRCRGRENHALLAGVSGGGQNALGGGAGANVGLARPALRQVDAGGVERLLLDGGLVELADHRLVDEVAGLGVLGRAVVVVIRPDFGRHDAGLLQELAELGVLDEVLLDLVGADAGRRGVGDDGDNREGAVDATWTKTVLTERGDLADVGDERRAGGAGAVERGDGRLVLGDVDARLRRRGGGSGGHGGGGVGVPRNPLSACEIE